MPNCQRIDSSRHNNNNRNTKSILRVVAKPSTTHQPSSPSSSSVVIPYSEEEPDVSPRQQFPSRPGELPPAPLLQQQQHQQKEQQLSFSRRERATLRPSSTKAAAAAERRRQLRWERRVRLPEPAHQRAVMLQLQLPPPPLVQPRPQPIVDTSDQQRGGQQSRSKPQSGPRKLPQPVGSVDNDHGSCMADEPVGTRSDQGQQIDQATNDYSTDRQVVHYTEQREENSSQVSHADVTEPDQREEDIQPVQQKVQVSNRSRAEDREFSPRKQPRKCQQPSRKATQARMKQLIRDTTFAKSSGDAAAEPTGKRTKPENCVNQSSQLRMESPTNTLDDDDFPDTESNTQSDQRTDFIARDDLLGNERNKDQVLVKLPISPFSMDFSAKSRKKVRRVGHGDGPADLGVEDFVNKPAESLQRRKSSLGMQNQDHLEEVKSKHRQPASQNWHDHDGLLPQSFDSQLAKDILTFLQPRMPQKNVLQVRVENKTAVEQRTESNESGRVEEGGLRNYQPAERTSQPSQPGRKLPTGRRRSQAKDRRKQRKSDRPQEVVQREGTVQPQAEASNWQSSLPAKVKSPRAPHRPRGSQKLRHHQSGPPDPHAAGKRSRASSRATQDEAWPASLPAALPLQVMLVDSQQPSDPISTRLVLLSSS